MGDPITFLCDGCHATLTVPAELAGISGPCPYCRKEITSPRLPVVPVFDWAASVRAEEVNEIAALPAPVPVAVEEDERPRQWLTAQLMQRTEAPVRKDSRRIPPTLWAAAAFVFFAGGIGAVWALWTPADPPQKVKDPEVAQSPQESPRPRPAQGALASADEPLLPEEAMPSPADEKPAAAPVVTTAVARNVGNGANAAPAPVIASPAPAPAAVQETDIVRRIRKAVPSGGPLAVPGEAIVRFMAAATWQERLKYTLCPEKMKPLMESYYQKGGDGPIIPEEVELTRLEPTEENPKYHYYSFIVYLPDRPAGIPLSVEDTAAGPRVEWRTFVECKDNLLGRFYKEYTAQPATLRVLVRRHHYFENDVPNQKAKECFELFSPDATGSFIAWADHDSQVFRKYFSSGERARWDVSSMMTLTLQWQKAESGVAWVKVQDVVAGSWHPDMLPGAAAK